MLYLSHAVIFLVVVIFTKASLRNIPTAASESNLDQSGRSPKDKGKYLTGSLVMTACYILNEGFRI